ncbi:MAG: transcription elongation factor Spt5 [Candidatus Aenigmarchaeota archaeon]|nr:transcription elongation factor Spt5 [Candidatus Aenigmarchaeota archaeon]
MIYTLRTTSGREDIVMDMLNSKIKAENLDVKAVIHPTELKGYIFIEGSTGDIHKALRGVMHTKGLIEKPVKIVDIQHFMEAKASEMKVDIDDIVEIMGGPFKSEKGKIKRIDKNKNEVTIELMEASIPIPVTIATEFIKVTKKVNKGE